MAIRHFDFWNSNELSRIILFRFDFKNESTFGSRPFDIMSYRHYVLFHLKFLFGPPMPYISAPRYPLLNTKWNGIDLVKTFSSYEFKKLAVRDIKMVFIKNFLSYNQNSKISVHTETNDFISNLIMWLVPCWIFLLFFAIQIVITSQYSALVFTLHAV